MRNSNAPGLPMIPFLHQPVKDAPRRLRRISVLERVVDWDTEDLGFIRLIIYPVEEENAFYTWWNEFEEEDYPNGLIIYKAE